MATIAPTIVALQQDICYALLSWEDLRNVNVVQERELRIKSEVEQGVALFSPRNGRTGAAMIVEMPTFRVRRNISAPGPNTTLLASVLCVEIPVVNDVPTTGTLLDAETMADMVLHFLHQWLVDNQGEFYPQDNPIAPAKDVAKGMRGYRVQVEMIHAPPVLPRVTLPMQAIDAGYAVTLTNDPSTPGSDIYYTLDQSFPAKDIGGNPTSAFYVGPFVAPPGTVLRWCAYKDGYMPSAVGQAMITP